MELAIENKIIFCTVNFIRREFFKDLCFISMYSVLNTLSEYTCFYILKTLLHTLLLLVFKIVESLQLLQTYELAPKTLWLLIPILFHTVLLPYWCKILSPYLVPVLNHWTWTKITPRKKCIFLSNLIKFRLW